MTRAGSSPAPGTKRLPMGRSLPPPPELGPLAEATLDRLMATHPLSRRPNLEWRRYRTTAGTANWATHTLCLGVGVVTDEQRLVDTLVHEYAHLLAFARAGLAGRGHGPAWRQAMADLGAAPERTHRYEVARNQARQVVVYRCSRCHESFHRRRRLPRGRTYRHAGCGGRVTLQAIQARVVEPE